MNYIRGIFSQLERQINFECYEETSEAIEQNAVIHLWAICRLVKWDLLQKLQNKKNFLVKKPIIITIIINDEHKYTLTQKRVTNDLISKKDDIKFELKKLIYVLRNYKSDSDNKIGKDNIPVEPIPFNPDRTFNTIEWATRNFKKYQKEIYTGMTN